MRIKINGPDELDYFASAKYAKKWIDGGNLATDSRSGIWKEESISHNMGNILDDENAEMKRDKEINQNVQKT